MATDEQYRKATNWINKHTGSHFDSEFVAYIHAVIKKFIKEDEVADSKGLTDKVNELCVR